MSAREGCLPRGCLSRGVYSSPLWTEWQRGVKTLPHFWVLVALKSTCYLRQIAAWTIARIITHWPCRLFQKWIVETLCAALVVPPNIRSGKVNFKMYNFTLFCNNTEITKGGFIFVEVGTIGYHVSKVTMVTLISGRRHVGSEGKMKIIKIS